MPVYQTGDDEYARWRVTNVLPQKQFGFVLVIASVPLGDLTSEQMRVLGELALAYGDGTVRVTPDQNLVFRWVPIGELRELTAEGRLPRPHEPDEGEVLVYRADHGMRSR